MDHKKMPDLEQAGTPVEIEPKRSIVTVDMKEWTELGARLAAAGPEKYEEILEALGKIVDAQETIAAFDWQLLFGARPSKRYMA